MIEIDLPGRLPLIFYYHRYNRYSFNALAGALDNNPETAEWPIHLAKTTEEVKTAAAEFLSCHERVLVAFSILTMQFEEIGFLVKELRSDYGSRVTLMAGGPHPTANVLDALQAGIDLVCRGEAEVAFPAAITRLAAGQDCRGVGGISFRTLAAPIISPRADPVDIETFPSFAPKRGMFGPIEITRGCPFACSYCQTSNLFGIQPRHRSIASIVRQAASLSSKSRKVVRLLSPNAFSYGSSDGKLLNLTAMSELLAAVRETVTASGRIIFGYFPSEVRPEHVTPDTLDLLHRFADNDEIVIGAQSGSDRVLEACHRSHSAADVIRAVTLARKAGYKVIVDFIFGLPGETDQDLRETISVLGELVRLGARIHVHPFAPLPQTAFAAFPAGQISPEIGRVLRQLMRRRALYGDCALPSCL
jgi:B12-binding domain/radical SAM domain protein